jgi:hypothetical protein
MKEYQIKTNIKTLKAVWNILQDLGLQDAMFGKSVKLQPAELVNKLIDQDMINELLRTITGDLETDFEELEIKEVIGIVANFFVSFSGQVQGFAQMIQLQNEKQTKKAKK